MKIYEYGKENPKSLLMFQCAAEPSWLFEEPARKLGEYFHVFFAGADGHDPSEKSDFTTVENYAEEAVKYLKEHHVNSLDALYGVSMGGAAALYLLAHQLIPVKKAIIDAGITPYPYPRWVCRLISCKDFCLIPLACMNENVLKKVSPVNEWTPEGKDPSEHYHRIYDFLKHHFSARTNYNVFWSANNYSMPDPVPAINTKIEYWYGSKEKKARKNDIAYVKKAFPQTVYHELNGYEHAQLVIVHPELFAQEAMKFYAEQ